MFCPKCGQQNEDGAMFCASCGEKFTEGRSSGNQGTSEIREKAGNVIAIIKSFFSDPKEFIGNAINDNAMPDYSMIFIVLELIAAAIFAFVAKISSSNLVIKYIKAYARSTGSTYSDDLILAKKIVEKVCNRGFITVLIFVVISVIIRCLFRYLIANSISNENNKSRNFSILSIISIVETIGFIVLSIQVFTYQNFLYIDYKRLEAAIESLQNISSNFSSFSHGLTETKGALTNVMSKIGGATKLGAVCTVIYNLIYVFEIVWITRLKNALNLSKDKDKAVSKLIVVFAVVLIFINLYYGYIVMAKTGVDCFDYIIKNESSFY